MRFCDKVVMLCIILMIGSSGMHLHASRIDSLLQLMDRTVGDDKLHHMSVYALQVSDSQPDSSRRMGAFILERVGRNNFVTVAHANMAIGRALLHQDHYSESFPYFQEAERAYEMGHNVSGLLDAYVNIGLAYGALERYSDALESYTRAEQLSRQQELTAYLAYVYTLMADVQIAQDDFEGYEHRLAQATDLYESLGIRAKVAEVSCDLADALVERHQYEKAESHYLEALSDFWALDDDGNRADVLLDLGVLYQKTGDSKALLFIQQALDVYRGLGDVLGQANCYARVGDGMVTQKDYVSAAREYEISERLYARIDAPHQRIANLKHLSHAYRQIGALEKSLSITDRWLVIHDSLLLSAQEEEARADALLRTQHQAELASLHDRLDTQFFYFLLLVVLLLVLMTAGGLTLFFYRRHTVEDQRMIALDQSVLRSNISPGLMFHSLTAIQSFILENKQRTAIEYLGDYSKLMRLVLKYSEEEYTTLSNEKELLELFLSLQALRFNERLKYIIHIDESIDIHATLIPPMLGLPFLERIIDRSTSEMGKEGILWVSFSKVNHSIVYRIHDRDISAGHSELQGGEAWERSKVYQDVVRRIRILNEGNETVNHIRVNVEDIPGKTFTGVMIEFTLPEFTLNGNAVSVRDQLMDHIPQS
ncbi:MAG: tetratricopeptide repeat protein [Marinilabiliaceae bacterium]|nr:tetratricopeptide repeat protein [Marinilabiliaceae bacterium]